MSYVRNQFVHVNIRCADQWQGVLWWACVFACTVVQLNIDDDVKSSVKKEERERERGKERSVLCQQRWRTSLARHRPIARSTHNPNNRCLIEKKEGRERETERTTTHIHTYNHRTLGVSTITSACITAIASQKFSFVHPSDARFVRQQQQQK